MCGVCCVFTNCLGCTATKQHPQEAEKYNTYTIVSFPQSQKPEKDTPCWISKIIRFYPLLSSVFFFTKFSLSSSDEKFYLFILFSFADVNIESPPSMHPCKRICDITGFEAPYYDPRTNLRYANAEVFKLVRSLPNEYVQRYLALRNAAVVLK